MSTESPEFIASNLVPSQQDTQDQSQKNASTKNADEIKEPEPEKTSDNGEAMPTKRTKLVTCHLCLSIFAAVSGTGFVFGFNTGVLNNPMDHIKEFFNETKVERTGDGFSSSGLTWYWASCVAIWALFAIVGSFVSAYSCSRFGSKNTMLLNNVLLLIGALLQSLCKPAKSYEMFFIGRLVIGVNNGICTSAGPIYLNEIAPTAIRGAVGVIFQLNVVSGILVAQILGFDALLGSATLWPYLIGMNLVVGSVQLLTLPFCPDSPKFLLVIKGSRERASKALRRLRGAEADIDKEMEEMIEEDRKEKEEPPVGYMNLLTVGYLRRPLIIACVLAMSQQLSGINAVFYYSSPIFRASLPSHLLRDDPDFPKYMVSVAGAINLIFTVVAVFTIEPLGRRKSHIIGLSGMAVCALVVAILLSGLEVNDDQTCRGVTPTDATNYVSITLLLLSVAFFSIGPGPIPWVITAEMFTSRPRPKAISIANTVNWLCNFAIALGFEPLINAICGWVFIIFAILLIIFIFYLAIKVPKTAGLSVQDVVATFKLAQGMRKNTEDEEQKKEEDDKRETTF